MSAARVTVNGRDVSRMLLFVPNVGVWFADLDLADETPFTGSVVVRVGDSELRGTVDDAASGTFGKQRRTRVIAGAAGWRKELKPAGYRNDAGVKASRVILDAAQACGETIGTIAPVTERLGKHYAREAGLASDTIRDAARGTPWWVDYAGVTHVSARTNTTPRIESYERLAFEPRGGSLTLQVDDLSVGVGSIITKDLDAPVTITSFELEVTPTSMRMRAWTGKGDASNLARGIRALMRRNAEERITWPCRYRVVEQSGDRADLQIVRKGTGAPDLLSVPLWPGLGSAHVQCVKGAEVIVQFVDGDRADPIVTGFAGRGATGAVAKRVVLGAASGNGADAARKGDAVSVPLIPFQFTGTIGGSPASGLMTPIAPYAVGTIMTGAPGVGIGSDRGT